MKKRIIVVVVLAVLLASSTYAQTLSLFAVVQSGTPQEIQAAIDKGADVNAYSGSMTPLISAAKWNPNPDVITILLKAGAFIEARDTKEGGTALLWAAWSNPNLDVITTLLKAGADVNARDTQLGRTALIWAALRKSNPDVVIFFLKAGLDAKAKDKTGYTALDYGKYNETLKGTDALKQLKEASK